MPQLLRAVILDTSRSPFAHLKPVPISNVKLAGGFWQSRYQMNNTVTIPSQFQLLEKTGRLDNFRRAAGETQKAYQGYVFNDSDVYKWLEAAAWAMVHNPSDELGHWIDQAITLISKAQDKDGYLNTYFSHEKIRERWMNLQDMHELYCAGHLIQAAIAHQRVLGGDRLLAIAVRLADHICSTFGPSQVEGTCGHPEIEMAFVELYRSTGEQKYLDQAALFIDRRGRGLLGKSDYLLDHVRFHEMERLTGHAVRGLYLCCGVADLILETGETVLRQALERVWHTMVAQQIYITGGLGARHEGEAFGQPYELPNARAYAETCAAIGNVMWNWRLLQMDGNPAYADLMEWALYNAVLPGIALDVRSYFYVNPLKDDGAHRREEWFDCACCPPNIARTIAEFPGFMYGISSDGIWLHHYAQSSASLELMNGLQVRLAQATDYPWDGRVKLHLTEMLTSKARSSQADKPGLFSLYLRLPAWLGDQKAIVTINGQSYKHHTASGSYLEIRRVWAKEDSLELELPMNARFIESHPLVEENSGHVAVSRGPLVYCLEAADNPQVQLSEVRLDPSSPIDCEYDSNLLGGVTKLYVRGFVQCIDSTWNGHLYRACDAPISHSKGREAQLIAIPYFSWANRQPGWMAIWNRVK